MTYEEWMAEFNDTWIKQHLVHKYPPKQYIPRLLHLIWVGKAEQPDIILTNYRICYDTCRYLLKNLDSL